ncbi:MAG: hypothetical protein R2795_23190 [Saprospiraceae bacterium]
MSYEAIVCVASSNTHISPVATSPANMAIDQALVTTLQWSAVAGASLSIGSIG